MRGHTPQSSYLVVKVCFSSSLRPQSQFGIGHLLRVMLEASAGHGQDQHHDCDGDEGDDGAAGALGSLGHLRDAPCVRPLA